HLRWQLDLGSICFFPLKRKTQEIELKEKTKFEQTLVENLYRAGVFIKLEILIFRVHIFTCTCLDPIGSFLHTHYCLYSGYFVCLQFDNTNNTIFTPFHLRQPQEVE
ncbi:hypothetical protein ACJX0J_012624, partial [Zea mays]